ncbi:MAG: AMP-binding protein [Flavobacteriales bacterium]|nr:AMP-binding protein [Flavobacteriales bacterium]
MESRIWHQHYPAGVPTDINPDSYPSILQAFEDSCDLYGDKVAFENMGVQLTFNQLRQRSHNFAAWLQKNTDLKSGDRIALQMPNLLQYPVCIYGSFIAGLVVVNVNPLYTAREMEHQLNDSGAKAIVIVANFCHELQQCVSRTGLKHIIVTRIPDLFPQPKQFIVNLVLQYVKKMVPAYSLPNTIDFRELTKDHGLKPKLAVLKNSDTAFLQYTGGTTGVSKGAVLTHRNVIANMEQMKAWMGNSLVQGEEVIITPLPMYHIFSLTVNCMAFICLGGKNVLVTNPRDIPAFIKELKGQKWTVMTGVNTLFNALLNNEEFKTIDFSGVKAVIGGAMAIQRPVAEKWKEVTGTVLVEGYGLTESSPVASANPLDGSARIGTIGVPVPGTDMKLTDENGKEVPVGERGEILIKGPQVMQGYYNRPEETDNQIKDGWLRTGDVAVMAADGYFTIVDRIKDMILVSGFNVYPNEVEEVIASHPKVLEVAAIGVPDEKSNEAVKVFVVKKDASLTEKEIKDYCAENLTGYKRPKYVVFRDELPKTNVGKILRRALREEEAAKG